MGVPSNCAYGTCQMPKICAHRCVFCPGFDWRHQGIELDGKGGLKKIETAPPVDN